VKEHFPFLHPEEASKRLARRTKERETLTGFLALRDASCGGSSG
jgi:hypothetical protein